MSIAAQLKAASIQNVYHSYHFDGRVRAKSCPVPDLEKKRRHVIMFLPSGFTTGWDLAATRTVYLIISHKDRCKTKLPEMSQKVGKQWIIVFKVRRSILRDINGDVFFILLYLNLNIHCIY